jgi:DUF4097 and DUF4098 domain-containing protein YvlB
MMENFEQIAAGATELKVRLKKGDLVVRAGEGAGWRLAWRSADDQVPLVSRDGGTLRIEQPSEAWELFGQKRMDLELTLPAGMRAADLRTGHGRFEAHGLEGALQIHTGHGGATLQGCRADVDITTGHGNLSIERHRGRVSGHSGHGRLRVEGLEGDADLRTGHGHVDVVEAQGRLQIATGHGRFEVVATGGELELHSGHGNVDVTGPRALALRVENGNGNVRVEGGSLRGARIKSGRGDLSCTAALEPGRYELNTGLGSIEAALPSAARARIEAHTGFGRVHSDVPLVQVGRSGPMPMGGARMVGSIGEGEPEIELSLRTGKGNLRIHSGAAAGTVDAEDRRWERPLRGSGRASGERDAGARFSASADRIAAVVEQSAERVAEIVERRVAPEVERRAEQIAERIEREVGPAVEQHVAGVVDRWVGGGARSPQTPLPPPVPPVPPGGPPPGPHGPFPPGGPTPPGFQGPFPPDAPPPGGPDGGPPTEDEPGSSADQPDAAVLKILEAVARGEITPQDAERLLGQGA